MFALYIAVAWGLGLLMHYMVLPWKIFIAILALTVLVLSYHTNRKRVYILFLIIVLGTIWAWSDDQRSISKFETSITITEDDSIPIIATGMVDSFPVVDGDRLRFFLKTNFIIINDHTIKAKERIWVNLRLLSAHEQEYAHKIMRGDQLQLSLNISLPKRPTNPGAFDFSAYLWQQYTKYEATGEGLQSVTLSKASSVYGWQGITKIRSFLEDNLDHVFTEENSGLLKAMLLGNQKEVSIELEEAYRNTGIIHILAISGTHVMLVIGALIMMLRSLRFTRERTYEILLIFLPFYMILTGLSPSVVRASLMGMIYLFAKRIHLSYSASKAISIVFILLTFIQPRMLFGVGFQLSFAVSLGLILFTESLAKKIKNHMNWLPSKAPSALSLTIVAQLCAFPILAITFHQFPLASIPMNLLLMPIYALIIPWGYLTLLLASIWTSLGAVFAFPLDGLLSVIHYILEKVSQFPHLLLSIGALPLWWWIVYFLIMILFVTPLKIHTRKQKTGIIFLCILLLLSPLIAKELEPSIKVTFLDVGQGDSILIQGPRNQAILIDGGGEGFYFTQEEWQQKRNPYEVGKNVVVPALRSLGVTKLNWVVLTHGDGDHIGGLREVIRSFPVQKVLVNGLEPNTELELALQAIIAEKEIPIYKATAGPWLKWSEEIHFEILNPVDHAVLDRRNDNDASIVVLLSAFGRNMLFTGDLEAEGEKRTIEQNDKLVIDVLKVGHHGSKSSTTEYFIDGVTPKIAIVSVGKNNRYDHPHPEVMQRLEEYDVEVFRTDRDGAITLTLNPKGKITYLQWK